MLRFLGLPELASEHGAQLDGMIVSLHWAMLIMFVGWGAYFLYLVFRFRAGANPKASYAGVKGTVAFICVAAAFVEEMILLFGSSIPIYVANAQGPPPGEQVVVVRAVGEQFAWTFHYPGADGAFGRTDPKLIDTQTNPLGLDRDDPAGKDDIVSVNQLHLPVGKTASIHLSSKDVIHSFYLPEMRVKQDTIPGLTFRAWFKPTVTTAEMRERKGDPEFNYEVACAQLCGLGHARMRGFLTIDTPEEYQAWLAEQAPGEEDAEADLWG